jgi:hypothetical protein
MFAIDTSGAPKSHHPAEPAAVRVLGVACAAEVSFLTTGSLIVLVPERNSTERPLRHAQVG